ncbi:MAG: hypothetical protein UY48_C0006G0047 [Candidatus Gottesmanbacteria bacterium GW2011_GWB1_49_7]|uniref:Uncharacterized protein n=1 Tax=Candidatus Gottesmanbacteria bacterium GW2011_GWB1_49_7 TaxID=1618448 RepID=A0A0G1Z2J9_9BACT|nr:MAG: hypothetical protein UY48_C0006G0047 [Candidatus Gottesmanbacteria bacterium GW2011_GWB1_49_7]
MNGRVFFRKYGSGPNTTYMVLGIIKAPEGTFPVDTVCPVVGYTIGNTSVITVVTDPAVTLDRAEMTRGMTATEILTSGIWNKHPGE